MYFWLKIFMKIYIFKWELKYLEMNKIFIYKKNVINFNEVYV